MRIELAEDHSDAPTESSGKKIVYLAGPFGHINPDVTEARLDALCRAAHRLNERGHIVISPVLLQLEMAKRLDLPLTWDYWGAVCVQYMSIANIMYWLPLDGWEESIGLKAEFEMATNMGLEIQFLESEYYATT
jgi:hypothetical protein